jgi:hypothetical protein
MIPDGTLRGKMTKGSRKRISVTFAIAVTIAVIATRARWLVPYRNHRNVRKLLFYKEKRSLFGDRFLCGEEDLNLHELSPTSTSKCPGSISRAINSNQNCSARANQILTGSVLTRSLTTRCYHRLAFVGSHGRPEKWAKSATFRATRKCDFFEKA